MFPSRPIAAIAITLLLAGVRAGAARVGASRGADRRARRDRRRGRGAARPGDRRADGDALRLVAGERRSSAGVPLLRARGRLPGDVRARREGRAPRPRRRARDRDHEGDGRPARARRDRRRALRTRRVGRIVTAAHDPRRRHARVREDLLDLPRAGGPLVPHRTDDPLRAIGGRDPDRVGSPSGDHRGLLAPVPPGRRYPRRRHVRHRRAHAEPRVHAGHGVLRGLQEPRRLGDRRRGDRRRAPARPHAVGRRRRAPRSEAGEHAGQGRAPAARRLSRVWRSGRRRGARPSTWRT